MQGQITKAKWLADKELLVATTDGRLCHYTLKEDDQQALYLDLPAVLYQSEGQAAIWDIAVRHIKD